MFQPVKPPRILYNELRELYGYRVYGRWLIEAALIDKLITNEEYEMLRRYISCL